MRNAIRCGAYSDYAWVSARREIFDLVGRIRHSRACVPTAGDLLRELLIQLDDGQSIERLSQERCLAILRSRLSNCPHLIVADGLESVADGESVLDLFAQLAGVSTVLCISRMQQGSDCPIPTIHVPQLDRQSATALLRHELHTLAVSETAVADGDLNRICDTVGGNPLALRFVARQLRAHGIDTILTGIRAGEGQAVEALYNYLYGSAWTTASDTARKLLLSFPQGDCGVETLDEVWEAIDHEDGDVLYDAIAELVNLGLIDRSGDMCDARYSISPLTRSFLLRQALEWRSVSRVGEANTVNGVLD